MPIDFEVTAEKDEAGPGEAAITGDLLRTKKQAAEALRCPSGPLFAAAIVMTTWLSGAMASAQLSDDFNVVPEKTNGGPDKMRALFAAALDKRIDGLYLSGGLTSFREVVDSELYKQSFANFVPGLLNHTDLPEVAASIAPRRIVLAGAVNAKDETADVATVRQIYAGGNLSIEPKAKWTVERLVSFAGY